MEKIINDNQRDLPEEKALESGKALALKIASILDEKKAHDIKIINVNRLILNLKYL